MPKFSIEISDTVTYERTKTVDIEAVDETAAEEAALEMANDGPDEFFADIEEEQIDNTPWEAHVSYPHSPDNCPSNHRNNGGDICADCGADLG